jgi:hypothetical protein
VDLRRASRHLVALYPASIRRRHGDEIGRLLAESDRPLRDAGDVLRHAIGAHLEVLMHRAVVRVIALVAAGVSLTALGFSLNDLERGVVEVPEHWWSSLVAGCSLVAVAVVVTLELRQAGRRRGAGPPPQGARRTT